MKDVGEIWVSLRTEGAGMEVGGGRGLLRAGLQRADWLRLLLARGLLWPAACV